MILLRTLVLCCAVHVGAVKLGKVTKFRDIVERHKHELEELTAVGIWTMTQQRHDPEFRSLMRDIDGNMETLMEPESLKSVGNKTTAVLMERSRGTTGRVVHDKQWLISTAKEIMGHATEKRAEMSKQMRRSSVGIKPIKMPMTFSKTFLKRYVQDAFIEVATVLEMTGPDGFSSHFKNMVRYSLLEKDNEMGTAMRFAEMITFGWNMAGAITE